MAEDGVGEFCVAIVFCSLRSRPSSQQRFTVSPYDYSRGLKGSTPRPPHRNGSRGGAEFAEGRTRPKKEPADVGGLLWEWVPTPESQGQLTAIFTFLIFLIVGFRVIAVQFQDDGYGE